MLSSADSLDLFRLVVEQAQDGIIFADREGVIQIWNSAAAELFGYLPEEAVGRSFAVMEAFGIRTAGLFAKLVWAFVHIQFLVVMSSRLGTLFRWSWKLLTRQRLARLIIEPEASQDAIAATQPNGQRTNGEAEKSRSDRIARVTVQ